MRNLLANHLMKMDQLSPEEIEVWKFCKKVEGALSSVFKRYHTFEHKMSVSARDRMKVLALKLTPYNGSIDLRTMLQYSDEWRNMVLTEVYFNTGGKDIEKMTYIQYLNIIRVLDVSLELGLKKELCWQYLLEMNQIELLKNWVDLTCEPDTKDLLLKSSDYLTKSFYNLFADWPITESMLDMVNQSSCMQATKTAVLDRCSLYGFYCSAEKKSLHGLISRIENNFSLPSIRSIFKKPSSNVDLDTFDQMIFTTCMDNNLRPVIVTCLGDSSFVREKMARSEYPWLEVWNIFDKWNQQRSNKAMMLEAMTKSADIFPLDEQEIPIFDIALTLIEEKVNIYI